VATTKKKKAKKTKPAAKKPAKKAAKKFAKKPVKKSGKKAARPKAAPKKTVKPSAPLARRPSAKPVMDWTHFFSPLDDRLVVKPEGVSEKTAGGLYIPASVEERPSQGEVLLVGRGHRDKKGRVRPMDVKAGETILFATYAGVKMILNDQEVLMLREGDVLGVLG
jgi:chaperonin GroES